MFGRTRKAFLYFDPRAFVTMAEIPLPCMRNLFSVASVLEVKIIHIKIVRSPFVLNHITSIGTFCLSPSPGVSASE